MPRIHRLLIAFAAIMMAVILIGTCTLYIAMKREGERILARQKYILYHINHQKLAESAAFIWQNRSSFRPHPHWHNLPSGDFSRPDPNDSLMPATVATIQPNYIDIHEDGVRFEFGGGGHHFGLTWFQDNSQGGGDKQLGPQLWYYDEHGQVPGP